MPAYRTEDSGPRPPSQAVDWLFSLADALSYMRQKRRLHSNVRPSKIYIDEENQVLQRIRHLSRNICVISFAVASTCRKALAVIQPVLEEKKEISA